MSTSTSEGSEPCDPRLRQAKAAKAALDHPYIGLLWRTDISRPALRRRFSVQQSLVQIDVVVLNLLQGVIEDAHPAGGVFAFFVAQRADELGVC